MIDIYNELYRRGHKSEFEKFINNRFPYIIDKRPVRKNKRPIKQRPNPVQRIKEEPQSENLYKNVRTVNRDDKKIFSFYSPGMLTFPQRIIFSGPKESLEKRVKLFIADKKGVDYLIIDDKAYIEYFELRYSDVIDQISEEDRELYKYRQSLK